MNNPGQCQTVFHAQAAVHTVLLDQVVHTAVLVLGHLAVFRQRQLVIAAVGGGYGVGKGLLLLRAGPVGMECQRGHTLAKGVVFQPVDTAFAKHGLKVCHTGVRADVTAFPAFQPAVL